MITAKQLNSTKLYLPLFVASRNRIKKYNSSVVRNYINKKIKNYNVPCFKEDEVKDENDDAHKIENENQYQSPSLGHSKTTKYRRKSEISWHLAPNRYTIPRELGCSKNGVQWSRSKRTVRFKRDAKLQNQSIFYEISMNFFEKSRNKCNRNKGKFSTDLRKLRPTTRFMITNPVTCWRNPSDPGPTSYFVGIFERTSFPKIAKKHFVPYKFLPYSCVPENLRLKILGKSSFSPGPGRYELLDDEPSLRIKLRIQTQKLLKFRRLNFKKIDLPKQKSDSIRHHIFGYGFTRLFRMSNVKSKKLITPKKDHHRTNRDVRMFPSFEYMKMITNPERSTLSMRTDELLETSSGALRFNCLVKVLKRRQLRDNKKVVFGSGMSRFKDSEIPICRNQSKLPRLVNFPIMTVNPKEIKTKLHVLPERLRGIYKSNRIQPFKFQPIPPLKLLLDEKEVRPEQSLEVYPNELNPMDFLKSQFKKNFN